VEHVYVDFGTAQQRRLDEVDVDTLRRLDDEGQFPAGSMGPKVQAVIDFLTRGGKRAIITTPEALEPALKGQKGTRVTLAVGATGAPS
jgi:carbamate kinase